MAKWNWVFSFLRHVFFLELCFGIVVFEVNSLWGFSVNLNNVRLVQFKVFPSFSVLTDFIFCPLLLIRFRIFVSYVVCCFSLTFRNFNFLSFLFRFWIFFFSRGFIFHCFLLKYRFVRSTLLCFFSFTSFNLP